MLASTGVPQGKDQGSRGERARNMSSDFCEVVRTVQQVGMSWLHQTVRHQTVHFFRTVQQWGPPPGILLALGSSPLGEYKTCILTVRAVLWRRASLIP